MINKKLICLDTETTGLNSKTEKIIEIGCVDITNGINNKKTFQKYINPEMHISSRVSKIHGITDEKVKNCLTFKDYVNEFLDFIKDATLIIHNANFDISFLNEELLRCELPPLKNEVIDTLILARSRFPGEKINLDSLMKKFKIVIEREYHGALLDSEILALVYLNLTQTQTSLTSKEDQNEKKTNSYRSSINKKKISINKNEIEKNDAFFKE
ncbi:DNA polymerase III subunit epsilon [Alphaproteobacteria bacterium endosymbiont of Tiliacea citrago]|uniref:DNA polymerase III subunit epsilon n=1 Tax=Alphaproteobacteria bacterium endosymbiont of Tiliacea citrago TaxID=3077944 RepID=UPI00313ECC9D